MEHTLSYINSKVMEYKLICRHILHLLLIIIPEINKIQKQIPDGIVLVKVSPCIWKQVCLFCRVYVILVLSIIQFYRISVSKQDPQIIHHQHLKSSTAIKLQNIKMMKKKGLYVKTREQVNIVDNNIKLSSKYLLRFSI